MLVAGPSASVGIEEKTLFVFICDVVIQVLSYGELPVELYVRAVVSGATLVIRFANDQPVPARRHSPPGKGSRRHGWQSSLLDETIDDRGVFRIEKRQINRFELRKVVLLLSHRRGIPCWHGRLAWQVSGRWVKWSSSRHCLEVYEDLCGRFFAITAHVALVYISWPVAATRPGVSLSGATVTDMIRPRAP